MSNIGKRMVPGLLSVLVLSTPAIAGPLILDPTSSCTGDNCEATEIVGSITNAGNRAIPFIIQAFGSRGECLRFDVSPAGPAFNLELVVTAPNGSLFRNDNRSGSESARW